MKGIRIVCVCAALFLAAAAAGLFLRSAYPRPHREAVQASGLPPALVYAVIKAESNFRTDAVSRAGAVGLMQIKPATAQFICGRYHAAFRPEALTDGAYNITVGCMYLSYLLERFTVPETALAAYNAGEGTVRGWLREAEYSQDGRTLDTIPYRETAIYVKKVLNFRKIYEFFYG